MNEDRNKIRLDLLRCSMGRYHYCPECDGEGNKNEETFTGKKVEDEEAVFRLDGISYVYPQLKRLIEASKYLGVEDIIKVSGSTHKATYFRAGESDILVMSSNDSYVEKHININI